jgi:hypothetical protein
MSTTTSTFDALPLGFGVLVVGGQDPDGVNLQGFDAAGPGDPLLPLRMPYDPEG